jgi:hypothetical protein
MADALAWLWRLGPVGAEPGAGAVGIGGLDDAAGFSALVRAGRLAGAVIFAAEPGAAAGPVPPRALRSGVARLPGGSVRGEFLVFDRRDGLVRSTLGVHAVRDGALLMLGASSASWGRLELAWVLDTVARFLSATLGRPLVRLPPIGSLRWDDVPGTAYEQLDGAAHSDRRQRARVARVLRACRRRRASVNLAVPVSGLTDGRETPIDRIWPKTVATVARGAASGAFEIVAHGTVHFDTGARVEGRLDPREFARLDTAEAGRRIDASVGWLREHVGAPGTFVAPAWGYSEGTLEAAGRRGLRTWQPAAPGPLLDATGAIHETLDTGLPGLTGVDYRPLAQLARAGLPPVLVIHGTLLDYRVMNLRLPRDALVAARLAMRRDLLRLLAVRGVRWVRAGELVERLRAHGATDGRSGLNPPRVTR